MYLPLFLNSEKLTCLVVGGGVVAFRKIKILLDAGCQVVVIAPRVEPSVSRFVRDGRIAYQKREFQTGDCIGNQLIISATSDPTVNRQVSDEARSLGIQVNVVDNPELCSFIFPAIARDEPLVVAVSTGGRAPFIAPVIRDRLREFTSGWGNWVSVAGRFRNVVSKSTDDLLKKKELYRRFIQAEPITETTGLLEEDDLDSWLDWLDGLPQQNAEK